LIFWRHSDDLETEKNHIDMHIHVNRTLIVDLLTSESMHIKFLL